MDGYFTGYGFVGFVEGKKMLFASDNEYYEQMEEDDHESQEIQRTSG